MILMVFNSHDLHIPFVSYLKKSRKLLLNKSLTFTPFPKSADIFHSIMWIPKDFGKL